ncbi:MAG: hypothetical protein JWN62_3191 [Acidimicrobiales bacterium]|nr:hypothetical protein [Acidimicrobiales bacterium]
MVDRDDDLEDGIDGESPQPDDDDRVRDGEIDEIDGEYEEIEPTDPINIDNPNPVATARRRHGLGGAMIAAGMFGLDQALTGKQKPDHAEIQESSSEPVDVDKDGITVVIDDATTIQTPALERRPPVGLNKKPKRR